MNRTKTSMEGGKYGLYHRLVSFAFCLIIVFPVRQSLSSAGPKFKSRMKFVRLLALLATFLFCFLHDSFLFLFFCSTFNLL